MTVLWWGVLLGAVTYVVMWSSFAFLNWRWRREWARRIRDQRVRDLGSAVR